MYKNNINVNLEWKTIRIGQLLDIVSKKYK